MAGVLVWCYKNNKSLWCAYEPNVSCELERLFLLGTQQTVQLGTISPSLSCYQVNFVQMTQVTIRSGSMREVKRLECDLASAVGKGVMWEFEGDISSHWETYDLNTMDVIEEGYTKGNQLFPALLDLQQSRVQLPYVIDFSTMTQMRVETGRVRKIQRRPLSQAFSPASHPLGGPSSMLHTSSMFPGQAVWQPGPQAHRIPAIKSKHRHQPYTAKSSAVNGNFNGLSAQVSQPSSALQLQLPPQNQAPMTRRKLQQTSGGSHTASLHQLTYMQQHQQLQQQQQLQMYHSSPHNFFHQNLHSIPSHYQQVLGHIQGPLTGFQYPTSSLPQPLSVASLSSVPQSLPHLQMSRPSSTSSLSSSSSSCSSMSVSSSQETENLPTTSKVSISKSKKTKGKTGIDVLKRYMCSIHDNLDTADCSICCNKLSEASSYGEEQTDAHEVVELNKCRHQFHKLCLLEMYNSIHKDDSLQCPSCKTIYGEKTGNCPPGFMLWRQVNDLTIPGYEGCGAIIVSYHISPGTQGSEHPSPGQSFSARGFPRQGFLPDCSKGRKVLKLLMEAFRRRLMFTIATSSTTGEINTVTWNEIHHKTEPHGNRSGHGYPDPHYLDNVLKELAAHGVTEDCLR